MKTKRDESKSPRQTRSKKSRTDDAVDVLSPPRVDVLPSGVKGSLSIKIILFFLCKREYMVGIEFQG